jgi:dipeptidyl aminopeptidase/acylaminoacyl peptidase
MGTCPIMGQQYLFGEKAAGKSKLSYNQELDSLWSSDTYLRKLSMDGNWVAFSENFPQKEDVLFLGHTSGDGLFTFPGTSNMGFSPNSKWFASLTRDKEWTLTNLSTRTKENRSNIADFAFSFDGKFVAYIQVQHEKPSQLKIRNLKNRKSISLARVMQFAWNPKDNVLLATIKDEDSLKLIKIDANSEKSETIIENSNNTIHFLKWNSTGTMALVSEETNGKYSLYTYGLKGTVNVLNDGNLEDYESNYRISHWEPYIADDGEKILFYRQRKDTVKTIVKHTAKVWDTYDPWIYPRMQFYEEMVQNKLLTAWYPKTGMIKEVETAALPSAAMNINHDAALVFNLKQYEPLYKYEPNADIYLKYIKSGKRELVVKNQYTEDGFVSISPHQKYIAYFKNKDWWVYHIKNGKTVNLTQNIQFPFQNIEKHYAGDSHPYGNPGWFPNDEYIILYDQYDIWLMAPDGEYKKRITHGREENKRYRIRRESNGNHSFSFTSSHNFSSLSLMPQNGLLLEMFDFDTYKTGYAFWKRNKNPTTIILENYKTDGLLANKGLKMLVYRKQRFNSPVGIYSYNRDTKREQLLYQSNKRLLAYDLGNAELLEYTLKNGKTLKGSLLYPAKYDPDKKYPMIVHIYERESQKVLDFSPPFDYGYLGFNALNYVTNGYFVLNPDLSYTIGDPGISALNGVTVAVNKVLEAGRIDRDEIGLIGHSFGGYETAFIVTQTDMFAAAVAGAASTDLINWYHDISWDWNLTQLWRMENQQWRFGASFYENKTAYYRNSPLHHVENIKTPLLLWTGKKDTNINWTQSVNMFIALKRLNKKAKLLLFENEPHVLFNRSNQKKLSTSIFKWMELYLKD